MSKRIVIAGGGISGLSAAYHLMKRGADVSVFEKNERGGGAIRTGNEEGYLFECGPNSTMNSNDEIDSLCSELGLEGERIFGSEVSKKRYVMRGGKLMPLPMSPGSFIRTGLWSTGGKMRLFKEPFVGKNKGRNESVAEFVSRRLGRELLDYALNPFVSGVYAGDPEKLELKSTFPKIDALEQEYGSLIKGALLKGFKGGSKSKRRKGIFSFKNGMEALPAAIVKALGDRFHGGVAVSAIEKKNSVYLLHLSDGQSVEADEVILSAPAYVNASILSGISPAAANELSAIDYAPIAIVYIGFKREEVGHPLDGFGCLIPEAEGKKLLGSLWSSSLFPGRAPEGMVSLTCFIGGARNRGIVNMSDDEVLADVMKDMKGAVGLTSSPSFVRIIRYEKAIPQYLMGHAERLDRINAALRPFPGIHLLGNFLKGISVADCVMNGTNFGLNFSLE